MQGLANAKLRITARYLDLLVIAVSYIVLLFAREAFIAWWPFDFFPGEERVLQRASLANALSLLIVIMPAWMLGLHAARSYESLDRAGDNQLFMRISWGSLIGAAVSLVALFLLKKTGAASRTIFVGFTLGSPLVIFLCRRYLVRVRRRRFARGVDTRNILVVAQNGSTIPLVDTIERRRELGLRVIGMLTESDSGERGACPVLGRLEDLPRVLEQHPVDQVYATGRTWNVDTMRRVADSCEEVGVEFSIDANFLGLRTARADLEELNGNAILSFSTTPRNSEALVLKRAIDVSLSATALACLSPLLAMIALAIKIEDREGRVIFGQQRSGLNGRAFTMWKFRSMVADAEKLQASLSDRNEVDGPVFKIAGDPRVTRVGRLIRKLSLDELPQFWNVLVGEMSLVGPRPPIPAEVERYERWQMRRLSMKPGLTCLWQVGGRNDIDFKRWMELDLEYIDNWSLFLDLKLLFRTPKAVIMGTGK